MTELLFHQHSYLQEFDATVTDAADAGVALDRTAFYTGGGGQPSDIGVLSVGGRDYVVSGVKREGGLLLHLIDGDLVPEIEWLHTWFPRTLESPRAPARFPADSRRRIVGRLAKRIPP